MRAAALLAIAAGAVGSLALMVRAGPDAPWLLKVLIGGWVVSPFAALGYADAISARWPAAVRTTLRCVALALTVVTLVIYAAIAARPTRDQTPFFVLVPPASWVAIAAAAATAAWVGSRR